MKRRTRTEMEERPYSREMSDEKWLSLSTQLMENHRDVTRILTGLDTKVAIQNGRISKLEGWRGLLTGGGAVLTIIVLPVLGILAWMILVNGQNIASLQGQLGNVLKSIPASHLNTFTP